jgi:urea transport system ATP-binding protein
MSDARLAFVDLTGGYGGAIVVRGISGNVRAGEVLCVLGRNGVGKSTLVKLLIGHLRCWSGEIFHTGTAIQNLECSARSRYGISYCPQERTVFDDLSVRNNLTLMGDNRDLGRFEAYFARFPILKRRLKQQAGSLSGGEKKILSFSRALSEGKGVTLLDEPSEGVQWENILHMAALINESKRAGASMVIVEQNLEFAETIADRYLVLDQGRVVLEGTRRDLNREDLLSHLHV